MDGFARRRELSKEEIRQAAWDLFGQFGVERVSVVEIARKAGVSQATIYNNFGSKETLAREFVAMVVEQLLTRARGVLSREGTYRDKVAAFVQFISDTFAGGGAPGGDPTSVASQNSLQDDPQVRSIRDAARQEMITMLMRLAREGREQGLVQAGLSDAALRAYFGAFLEVFVDPEFRRRYHENPAVVQELGSLMLYGLSGRTG